MAFIINLESKEELPYPCWRSLINITRLATWILFPWFWRVRIDGLENIPKSGAALLAANHASYYDPILITRPIGRPLYYLAWQKLFQPRFFGPLIRRLGAIPLDMERGTDVAAYRQAKKIIDAGQMLTIFPEGQRSYDGELLPLRGGTVRIAIRTGVPIIPIWIEGAYRAWPRTQQFPTPFVPMSVRYMEPIMPRKVKGRDVEQKEEERLMMELRSALLRGAEEARRPV